MRYLLAGVSLLLALVCFAVAVGQRTIWAPPDTITEQLQDAVETPVLVIPGAVLATHQGRQEVTAVADGSVTAVVGRESDVLGWIGNGNYSMVVAGEEGLGLDVVEGGEATVPTIAGSDMWVQEATADGEVSVNLAAPEEYVVALVTDGEAAAPSDVRVEWPNIRSMPLFGPFMTAGFVLAALALLLLLLGVRRHRRVRGPQRRLSPRPGRRERREIQRGARRGLPVASDPALEPGSAPEPSDQDPTAEEPTNPPGTSDSGEESTDTATPEPTRPETTGARSVERRAQRRTRIVLPAAVVALALAGCSPQYWPDLQPPEPSTSASETPQPTSLEDTLPPADVTVRQFERILANTREVVAEADEARDADLAAERLGGPALDARTVTYRVQGEDAEAQDVLPIPDGEVSLLLPQQSATWPRSVLAVIDRTDALMFEQASPRENFRVVYQYRLQEGERLSGAAPEVGAPGLPPTTPLLAMRPESVAGAYADVLLRGSDSEFADAFPADGDTLQEQIGAAYKDELRNADTGANADISFDSGQDEQQPITLVADSEGGAYVATSFTETTTYRPNEEGVTISPPDGAQQILSPVDESESGLSSTYQIQVFFYVPPASGDDRELRLLGFSQALLSVEEVS